MVPGGAAHQVGSLMWMVAPENRSHRTLAQRQKTSVPFPPESRIRIMMNSNDFVLPARTFLEGSMHGTGILALNCSRAVSMQAGMYIACADRCTTVSS